MLQNVPKSSVTVGTIAKSDVTFSGQANTRLYSPADASATLPKRNPATANELGMQWNDQPVHQVLAQEAQPQVKKAVDEYGK